MKTTLKKSELSRTYKVGQEITLKNGFVGIISYIGKQSNYDIRSENGREGQPTLEGTKGWLGGHRIIPNDWEAIYEDEVHESEIVEDIDKGMKVVNRNCPKSGPMLKKMIAKAKEEGYSGLMFVSEKQGNTQFHFNKVEEKEAKMEPCFAICNDGNFFEGFPPVYIESSTKRGMLKKLSTIYRMMNPEAEFFPYSIEDLKTRYYMGSAVEAYIADDWATVSKHGERMKDFVSRIEGVLSFDEFVEKYKVEPIEEEPVPGEMFEGVLIPDEIELLGEFLDEDEEEILRESYGEDVIPYEDGIEL